MRNDPSRGGGHPQPENGGSRSRRPPHHDFRRKRLERCRPPEGVAACRRERLRPRTGPLSPRPSGARSIAAERPWRFNVSSTPCPTTIEPPAQGETLRSFRGVIRHGAAHCLEAAALAAAVIMEQHGRPPLVLSFESIDGLDHVIYVYQSRGLWGSVARSRDPGLHGRRAVFGFAARARPELRRPLRRSLGTRDRLRRRRPASHGHDATGGCRVGTSGRSSGCSSTTRTAPSGAPTRASVVFARATGAFKKAFPDLKPSVLTSVANGGPHCRRSGGTSSGS